MIEIPAAGPAAFLATSAEKGALAGFLLFAVLGTILLLVRLPGKGQKANAAPRSANADFDFLLSSTAAPREEKRSASRRLPKAVPIISFVLSGLCLSGLGLAYFGSDSPAEAREASAAGQLTALAGAEPDPATLNSILLCGEDASKCGGFLIGDTVVQASQGADGAVAVERIGTGRIGEGLDGSPAIILDSTAEPTAIPTGTPEPSATPTMPNPSATPTKSP